MKKKILVCTVILFIIVAFWSTISKASDTSSSAKIIIEENKGKTNLLETTVQVLTTNMTEPWLDEDSAKREWKEVKKDNEFGVSSLTLNSNVFCIEVGRNWTKNMKLSYFRKVNEENTGKAYILAHKKEKSDKFIWDSSLDTDTDKIKNALSGHYKSASQAALWLICGQDPRTSHLTIDALKKGYKLYGDAITFKEYRNGYAKVKWIATEPKVQTQSDGNFAVGPYKIKYTSKKNNKSDKDGYEIKTDKIFGGITKIQVWADTQTTSNKELTIRNRLLD